MISNYRRKQSQYLQKIESFAVCITDGFSISTMQNRHAAARNEYIRKAILFVTFCCLSTFFLLNISFHTPELGRDHLLKTMASNNGNPVSINAKSINSGKNSKTLAAEEKSSKKTDRYNHHIKEASERYQVDPYLIKAIIMTESSYNPKAVSYRGAKGLMQLMPTTAEEVGVEDCFNPEDNINGGVKYFSKLLARFRGNVDLALAAYNAGSTKVRKYRGVPPFRATRQYIKKVNEYYNLFKEEDAQKIKKV